MKVWIVTTHWHYDDTTIRTVHATEEGGKAALAALTAEESPCTVPGGGSFSHFLSGHEVQS